MRVSLPQNKGFLSLFHDLCTLYASFSNTQFEGSSGRVFDLLLVLSAPSERELMLFYVRARKILINVTLDVVIIIYRKNYKIAF